MPGYGARVRKVLESLGLTLADLGDLACLSSATVSRAVNGDLVTARTEKRIEDALAQLRQRRSRIRARPVADD